MINNRQSGRRRGRGGQRQQGGNPNGNNGNRIDNRARGNANQLYEKYKTLAADAQRQGDRVNTEYYLQFADHYFRVLAENRSRFEEQNPSHNQRRGREDAFDDEDDGFEDDGQDVAVEAEPRRQRNDRPERDSRPEREGRPERDGRDRGNRQNGNRVVAETDEAAEASPVAVADEEAPKPARRPRQRREARAGADDATAPVDADRLPAAFGVSLGVEGEPIEEAPKPRRRTRRAANETAEAADAAE